jgi:hypothetical protein
MHRFKVLVSGSSGPKLSNRRFNRFLTVGPVNQRTDGLTGSMSGPVLITMGKSAHAEEPIVCCRGEESIIYERWR